MTNNHRDVCTNNSLLEFVISTKYECENTQIYHSLFDNTNCNGQPQAQESITPNGDIICDGISNCPYVIVRVYQNGESNCDDNTEWNDIPFIVNVCQSVENDTTTDTTQYRRLSCDDSIGLTRNIYDNDNCEGTPINSTVKIGKDECGINEEGVNVKFIKCGIERHNTTITTTSIPGNGSVSASTTTVPPEDEVWFITAIVFICLFGVLLCGSAYLAYSIYKQPTKEYNQAPQVETTNY